VVFASLPYRAGKKEPDFAQVVDVVMLLYGKTVHLLGIAFSSTGHTVQDWKEEVLA